MSRNFRASNPLQSTTPSPHHHHTITQAPHHHHTITTLSPHHHHTITSPPPHYHHTITITITTPHLHHHHHYHLTITTPSPPHHHHLTSTPPSPHHHHTITTLATKVASGSAERGRLSVPPGDRDPCGVRAPPAAFLQTHATGYLSRGYVAYIQCLQRIQSSPRMP